MPARKETRLRGRTWVNRWQPIDGTSNGVTVSTDETGLITVSGEVADGEQGITIATSLTDRIPVTPGAQLTGVQSRSSGDVVFLASFYDSDGAAINGQNLNITTSGVTKTVPENAATMQLRFYLNAGRSLTTGTFRVMLVDGDEVPDCFTAPGVTSAEPTKLATANRNLLGAFAEYAQELPHTSSGVTWSDNGDGGLKVEGAATDASYYNYCNNDECPQFPPGQYSFTSGSEKAGATMYLYPGDQGKTETTTTTTTDFFCYLGINSGEVCDDVLYPQLELGSSRTEFERPQYTETALPEGLVLRSLPDGTADELVIRQDGTAYVERRTAYVESFADEYDGENYFSSGGGLNAGDSVVYEVEQTVEWLDNVTLPELPETFCEYPISDVPCRESVVYELGAVGTKGGGGTISVTTSGSE